VLGGRPLSRVLKEAAAPRNYRALWRMARLAADSGETAKRYFLGGGEYPWACPIRTPRGVVRPTLYSHHDVWTVNEVFFREDYRVDSNLRLAVDVGSNIGISALYFLTRNPAARCYLYEPDPRNAERLRRNLDAFAGRWELEEAAVARDGGEVVFARDPTGRYGRIAPADSPDGVDAIRVRCLGINDVLASVLDREEAIDVLKLDTEGLERETVAAIRPGLLERIGVIVFESESPAPLHGRRFRHSFANETVRLERMR
jgi:FkbM family methyltransferase